MKHLVTLQKMLLGGLAAMLIALCGGCADTQLEQNFFDKEYDQAGSRFQHYSIPDQIRIYLYGMQSVTPPTPVLSRVIAGHGQAAIPHILSRLSRSPTDQNVRDLVVVFEAMQRQATYNVAQDAPLLKRLYRYANGMTNKIWRGHTISKLDQIKQSNRDVE
jgi:hypothetical protein